MYPNPHAALSISCGTYDDHKTIAYLTHTQLKGKADKERKGDGKKAKGKLSSAISKSSSSKSSKHKSKGMWQRCQRVPLHREAANPKPIVACALCDVPCSRSK